MLLLMICFFCRWLNILIFYAFVFYYKSNILIFYAFQTSLLPPIRPHSPKILNIAINLKLTIQIYQYEDKGILCFWDFSAGFNTATLVKNTKYSQQYKTLKKTNLTIHVYVNIKYEDKGILWILNTKYSRQI